MFRTRAQFMALTLLAGIFLLRESSREPLAGLNERLIDFLSANARREEKPAPVTLVAIDEASQHEHPLPWSPGDFALFFNSANSLHPDLISTDEVLDWNAEDRGSQEAQQSFAQYSQILCENVRKSTRTVLGASLNYPEDADRIPPLEAIAGLRNVKGDTRAIPEFRVIETQPDEELRMASTQGFTNLPVARGSSRSVPLLLRYCGQVVPSFVLQSAILWEKITPDDVEVELGSQIRLGNHTVIPIDSAGCMRVNLALPIGRCTLEDVIVAAEQSDAKAKSASAESFSGKALVLSRTDSKAPMVEVALGSPHPRGEFFALALGTIQSRAFIRSAPSWSNWAAIAFFTLASLAVPKLSRGLTALLGTIAILVVALVALAIVGTKLIALSMVVPVGLAAFVVVARAVSP